jgi:hypothetical protein
LKKPTLSYGMIGAAVAVVAIALMIATPITPLAYASSTTPNLPFVSYEEIGEPHKVFISDVLEQVRKAIIEHPEDVRITFYPGELPDDTKVFIVYDNGTSLEFDDDIEVQMPSNITVANGYKFEDYDTILKPDGTRLFP